MTRLFGTALVAPLIASLSMSIDRATCAAGIEEGSKKMLVFVGTYTGGKSEGIYTCELDPATGALEQLGVTKDAKNPSFLAIHPTKRFLYSVSEVGDYGDTGSGAVTAFALDPASGQLKMLNHQSSTSGGPCHLVVDRDGQERAGGQLRRSDRRCAADRRRRQARAGLEHRPAYRLERRSRRQEGPHPHSINLDPAGRFAFVADLGLDKVLVYRFDPAKGTLTANDPPSVSVAPGSGPRHFAFHPSGKFAYVINEMRSTVTAFNYDAQREADGADHQCTDTVSTLPTDFKGENTTAEVQVHPSGKFLYGSNRGHDSIAIFAIDPANGSLTALGHEPTGGRTPRNFGIDPDGKFLLAANQDSDTIHVFRIDQQTGKLAATGQSVEIAMPACVKFVKREQ